MFSSKPGYGKLKTNLKLSMNRLKMLQKTKTALCLQARKDIANYAMNGKVERAKIRLEHIIREDYLIEAMEILELFCDLCLARFGLIEQMAELDDGLAEAISSMIWVAPRLQSDVPELRVVSAVLVAKYGKPYEEACRTNSHGSVSPKLMHKLSVQAPPKITVEKYLIEIAKYYNFEYEPDPQVMKGDEIYLGEQFLIDFKSGVVDENGIARLPGGSNTHPGDAPSTSAGGFTYPTIEKKDEEKKSDLPFSAENEDCVPPPAYTPVDNSCLPSLPNVPGSIEDGKNQKKSSQDVGSSKKGDNGDESDPIDFDDLTKRFEALKGTKK